MNISCRVLGCTASISAPVARILSSTDAYRVTQSASCTDAYRDSVYPRHSTRVAGCEDSQIVWSPTHTAARCSGYQPSTVPCGPADKLHATAEQFRGAVCWRAVPQPSGPASWRAGARSRGPADGPAGARPCGLPLLARWRAAPRSHMLRCCGVARAGTSALVGHGAELLAGVVTWLLFGQDLTV